MWTNRNSLVLVAIVRGERGGKVSPVYRQKGQRNTDMWAHIQGSRADNQVNIKSNGVHVRAFTLNETIPLFLKPLFFFCGTMCIIFIL